MPPHKSRHSTPDDQTEFFDESGWRHRLDTGDRALIPPNSDASLYILLAVILIGGAALFGASASMLLG